MLFACGMRRVEIVRSRIGDYHSVAGTLLARGKGDKIRTVPVVEQYRHFLDRHWDDVVYKLVGTVEEQKTFGDDFTRRAVSWTVERFCKESGIERFTPHDLRRSFATLLLKRGVPINVVQRLMGHANINTTAIYDKSGREAEIEAVKVLGRKNEEKTDA